MLSKILRVLYNIKEKQIHKKTFVIVDNNKITRRLLTFLIDEGFIINYKPINRYKLTVLLKYSSNGIPAINKIQTLSKQNYQYSVNFKNLKNFNSSRIGILIINANVGFISDKIAQKKHLGGKLVVLIS